MTKTVVQIGFIGMISGVFNALMITAYPDAAFPIPFVMGMPEGVLHPAFIFGILTGIFLIHKIQLSTLTQKIVRFAGWIAIAVVSYMTAAMFVIRMSPGFVPNPGAIHFALGGMLGALVLAIGYHFLIKNINHRIMLSAIAVGGIVPAVVFVLIPYAGDDSLFVPLLYIFYQTSILIPLVFTFNKNYSR